MGACCPGCCLLQHHASATQASSATELKGAARSHNCHAAQAPWLVGLVTAVGTLLLVVVGWVRADALFKPISESIEQKLKLMDFPDHKGKIGYQHEVR